MKAAILYLVAGLFCGAVATIATLLFFLAYRLVTRLMGGDNGV